MLINRLFKKKSLIIRNVPSIRPKNISIEVSDTCNLKCRICNQWREKNSFKKLGFKHIKKLIDGLSESFDNTVLEFSGPEPLTNQELLFQALEYAKNKGIKTALSTNGSLIDKETATRLIKNDLKHISISLDSNKPEVQDYIRRCEGLFEKNVSAIKGLVEAKQELCSKTIISVTCTITEYNVKSLIEIYNLCKSLKVDSVNYNAYAIDNSYFNKNEPNYKKDDFWIKKENIKILKNSINKILNFPRKNCKPIIATPKEVLKEIPNYFQKKEKFQKGICKAGTNYFHITNFGEITVCGKGPHLNIKDHKLKDILRSEEFYKTLTKTKKCKIPCLNNCFYLE